MKAQWKIFIGYWLRTGLIFLFDKKEKYLLRDGFLNNRYRNYRDLVLLCRDLSMAKHHRSTIEKINVSQLYFVFVYRNEFYRGSCIQIFEIFNC